MSQFICYVTLLRLEYSLKYIIIIGLFQGLGLVTTFVVIFIQLIQLQQLYTKY